MKLWLTTTKNKYFVKILWHLLGKRVKAIVFLVYSSDIVATFFFFFLSVFLFNFFFFSVFRLYLYIYIYIYFYTDTINFTIFSQLLKYQFLISQNKIIKYETVTNYNKNKYFVKMLWHLLGECVKTTVLLVYSICIFFFQS